MKKALNKQELKALATVQLNKGSVQDKARDFWFFSFQCNGMNIKDILLLRFRDIQGDKIIFQRAKTKRITKSKASSIVVQITPSIKTILNEWSQPKSSDNTFLFPLLTDSMDAAEQMRTVQNFTRFINQHIQEVAKKAGVRDDITTYWARHSFTTTIMRNGASIEMASAVANNRY